MITEGKITEIFCMADDFCKLAEVMLIMILFHTSGYRCFKHFYLEKVCKHLRHLYQIEK